MSNYNPGPQMCPAAKQIELDLLRTLPNNKHYESPHSPGTCIYLSISSPAAEQIQLDLFMTETQL